MGPAEEVRAGSGVAFANRVVLCDRPDERGSRCAAGYFDADRGGSGGPGSSTPGWTVWSTSRARVASPRSPRNRSRTWSSRPWSRRRSTPPTGPARRWPNAAGLSKSTIGRIWKGFGLKPHLVDGFKLSNDPLFVDKAYDVVGLYLNPPDAAVVLCVDEKSQVQALGRSQPAFPMMPGMPEKRTHDYVRNGTTSLFAAFNIEDGTVISSPHRRHRSIELKKFLAKIDAEVPADLAVHLICDNYGTHKTPAVKNWLHAHPRFQMHFTPTYSSWLNQVERFFAFVTEDLLQRSHHKTVQQLEGDIRGWIKDWNTHPKPFIWTKSADEILESLGRLLKRISGAGHEEMLTRSPPPSRRWSRNTSVAVMAPRRLTSIIGRNSLCCSEVKGASNMTPALLSSTSAPPSSCCTRSAAATRVSRSVTSASMAIAAVASSCTRESMRSTLRANNASRYPLAARARAVAAPTPDDAPVMTATRPLLWPALILPLHCLMKSTLLRSAR